MTLLIYLLALIGAIAFMFFSVDWGIGLYKWQSRIHIGRWTDRKVWQQAVEKKARQWLHQSPTVQKTEQDRLVLWDMLRGNYRSSTIQSWQDAGLLLALSEQDAQAYAKRHSSLFAKETWQVDQSLLAYALKKKERTLHRYGKRDYRTLCILSKRRTDHPLPEDITSHPFCRYRRVGLPFFTSMRF